MASSKVRREKIRARREARARRQMLYVIIGVAVLGALFLIAFSLQQQTKVVTPQPRPYAQGKTMGPPDAPVVIEEYTDFQCPFCARYATEVIRQLEETYLKTGTGKVRYIFRHMAFLGPESQDAAEAAECANEQGRFWDYADMLFANQRGENQGGFSLSRLKKFAADLGLNTAAFNTCLDSRRYKQVVEQETQQGQARGVDRTPTLFINNRMLESLPDFAQLRQLIEQLAANP